jgi:large subunit ribosomal protein L17
MPTPTKGARLGGGPAHERLILSNLATSLFEHGRITTTEAKARRLRPYAERLITKARRGDLHSRRQAATLVRNKGVLHTLFAEIGPRFAEREGGYLRLIKLGPRKGDGAPLVVVELVEAELPTRPARKSAAKRSSAKKAPAAAPAPAPAADESEGVEVDAAETSEDAGYGPDSHPATEDNSVPDGFPVKGNADSNKYHDVDSPWYDRTDAEVYFTTAEAAEAAGFERAGGDSADSEPADSEPADSEPADTAD